MANTNAPFGALLVDGEGKQFRVRNYPKKSGNAIYQGDLVILDASGTVDVGSTTPPYLGVAMASAAAASTADIPVCDDPDALFVIQASANCVQTDVFSNASIVATAGDAGLSRSKHALDSATIATTATLGLKILGLQPAGTNAYGSYARIRVKINSHAFKAGVVGV